MSLQNVANELLMQVPLSKVFTGEGGMKVAVRGHVVSTGKGGGFKEAYSLHIVSSKRLLSCFGAKRSFTKTLDTFKITKRPVVPTNYTMDLL